MEYMELVETETDGDERKRLMANYNMLSTAKTTITSVSSTLYSTSGIGVTLLLLGFCFAYVRKDNKMSKVGGETSEADKEKSEGTLRDCARCLSTSCSRVVDRRFMRRTKVAAIDVGCLLSAVSPVTTFSRLSRRVGGGAHRASEGSWSSWTSSTSWSSQRLQRWPALAPTHGRSKSPSGLTGLLLVPARTRR